LLTAISSRAADDRPGATLAERWSKVRTKNVHLLVLDTLADWEPGLAIAHINQPAPGLPSRYRVRSVGLNSEPVLTKGGHRILPELTVGELSASDSALLILPGADIWAEQRTDPALEKALAFVKAGVPVAAICGGTLGLARAGLLDARRHTSNAPQFLASTGYAGASHYVNEPVVEDDGVITAPATASLDFAKRLLEKLEVYSAPALDAWYALFRTGKPEHYFAFVEAVRAQASS
jgi:putative intracellular protease/amidase